MAKPDEMAQAAHPGAGKRIEYKWIALSVTTIGALMAAIDSTIVILALPDMMVKLHADLIEMVWVIMGYILISTVFLLTFGRVADMLGRVRMYNLGFVVFTVGSALCALSQSATQLILFRLLQGAGAALMMVNSPAIITEVFPPNERGRALGINGITWALGGIAGPLLGGFILGAADWRWIFYINVPIGIIGTVWGYRALHEMSRPEKGERFDPIGAAAFSLGLVSLLLALTLGIQYSWTSLPILSLFALFVVMVVVFFAWERRAPFAVLDLSLFKNCVYNFSVLAAMLQSLAMFAVDFLIVFYLQGVRGYDPLTAALLLIPLPIVSAIVGPLSGLLADHIGARIPATAGVLVDAAALVWFIARHDARDALLGDRPRLGRHGSGRRPVLVAEHQCRNEQRRGELFGCRLRRAGYSAPDGDGDQFCRRLGGCRRQSASRCRDESLRRHERRAGFGGHAGIHRRHPECLCSLGCPVRRRRGFLAGPRSGGSSEIGRYTLACGLSWLTPALP